MKLVNATGRTALAGFVTVISVAVASQAWAQQRSECPDARVSGSARQVEIPATVRSILDDPNRSIIQLQSARIDCEEVLSATRRSSIPALICVSRVRLELAKRNEQRLENYGLARCDSYRAGQLRGARGDQRTQTNALRAEALIGLLEVNPGTADTYRNELLSVHNAAAAQQVHLAVARMHVQRREANEALAEANGGHLQGLDRALTLIDIASINGGGVDVERVLTDAYNTARDSVATNSALGGAYFDRQNWARALTHLEYATAPGRVPEQGYENLQEQAFYYRSVIEADRGNYRAAREYADRAGNEVRALRQTCLVRLIDGGEEVYSVVRDANGSIVGSRPAESMSGYDRCNRLASSAEGQLLLGMFWLRRAQYMPAIRADDRAAWRAAVGRSVSAFRTGRGLLGSEGTAPLNWPAPARSAATLSGMLDYGEEFARYAESGCQGTRPDIANQASEVFSYYRVSGCGPSGN